jgi:uncharacterized membrane protein YphA (DoxX/SURF4 family)
MNRNRHDLAVTILQWVIGVIVFGESCLAFRDGWMELRAADHIHHLALVRFFTGGVETIAAVMFLIPPLSRTGGYALLVIFAWAILVHTLHGYFHELPLLIYGAGVFAVMTWRGQARG